MTTRPTKEGKKARVAAAVGASNVPGGRTPGLKYNHAPKLCGIPHPPTLIGTTPAKAIIGMKQKKNAGATESPNAIAQLQ